MPANRSKKAARYGALAEKAARERYGLDAEHDGWHDARAPDGRPVETKAAMLNRRSGTSRFRIFEDYHERLLAEGGYYIFVAYAARGRGISVEGIRSVDADALGITEWASTGGHRDSRQRRIPVRAIFDGLG